MSEMVNIDINHQGIDFNVAVDRETANLLLNDPEAAEQYVTNWLHGNSELGHGNSERETENLELEYMEEDGNRSLTEVPIWSSKRPTDQDHAATIEFLSLREKYATQFDDKKNRKNTLWGIIGNEMEKKGYYLGGSKRDIIEKLRQKFANLQKQYVAYIKHMGTTGEKRKEAPSYFEEMHSILGDKDKIQPKNLQDSLIENEEIINNEAVESEGEENTQEPSTSRGMENRFSSVNRPRPPSHNQQILQEIRLQHQENLQEKRRQFEILEKNMEIQANQRTEMLDKFDRFLDILGGKKRKREDSD